MSVPSGRSSMTAGLSGWAWAYMVRMSTGGEAIGGLARRASPPPLGRPVGRREPKKLAAAVADGPPGDEEQRFDHDHTRHLRRAQRPVRERDRDLDDLPAPL